MPPIKAEIPKEHTVPVKLKFSPQAAFRVYDEFTDSVTKDDQGNLYVETSLPDNEKLYCYLFSFGSDAEVIEPSYVRERIKEKMHLLLKKYET